MGSTLGRLIRPIAQISLSQTVGFDLSAPPALFSTGAHVMIPSARFAKDWRAELLVHENARGLARHPSRERSLESVIDDPFARSHPRRLRLAFSLDGRSTRSSGMWSSDARHFAPSCASTPHVVLRADAAVGPLQSSVHLLLASLPVRVAAVSGAAASQRPAVAVPDSSGAFRGHGSGSGRLFDSPTSGFRVRPRVLIVEDNDTTREMYAWSMRASGWLVEEAADGEAALYAAALFGPDVIVMDLRLPVLDGIEATRRLRETELTRHIPIVACSALNRAEDAKNAGCSAFVTKPCPPEDLRALVESVARRRTPSDPIE